MDYIEIPISQYTSLSFTTYHHCREIEFAVLIPPGIDGTYVVEQFPVSDACTLRELPELSLVEPVPGVEPDPQVLPPVSVATEVAHPDVVPVVGQRHG